MNDENAFFRRLLAVGPELSPRVRAALAAAATERGLASLAATGGLALEPLERAVELTWSFALGEDVPFDLHRAVRHAVDEALDDHASNLLATEAALGRAISDALSILDPASDRDAIAWCLERTIDGSPSREAAVRWSSEALARAASIEVVAIGRRSFGDSDDDAERRRARVASWRETHPITPWREPSGIPRRYVVLEVGRAQSSMQGSVSVPGHALYGIFPRDDDRPGFSLPDAIAYGMTPDERTLYVWRKVKQPGRSGVARADYDWYLERHTWPERAFDARHVVQDRDLIAWCSPSRLEVPAEGNGRVVVLRAWSEDAAERVFVVDTPEGTRETRDREEALRWAIESWREPA